MSYYPDNDLCLITIEVGEKTPEPVFSNCWKRFWADETAKKKDENRQCVMKRNDMKIQEAVQGIGEAQADKYEPVFYTESKGTISAIGARGKSNDLNRFNIDLKSTYMHIEKIRAVLSNVVKTPNNAKNLDFWEELLDRIEVE